MENNAPVLDESGKPKTAKQLEKDAKKAAKLAKFAEKQSKSKVNGTEGKKTEKQQEKKKEEKKVVTYDYPTKIGEKKNTEVELPTQYSPKYVEAAWYEWWKKEGFFKPEYKDHADKDNFVIVIPPPNVTANLHLGHALTNSIEDAIVRWHRMNGHRTLWVPGCDHAGIATQVVVEKKVKREEGLTRHDLGREEFIKRIWQWKNEKGNQIYHQLECLGSSPDWDRACFTMDDKLQTAVKEAFVLLHQDGTIYRSNRLVNWSCSLKSAISDIEVDKKELLGRTEVSVPGYEEKVEFGVIVDFAYEVDGSGERLVVSTTRIETMLGDAAVAVHPLDDRYTHLHGKHILHPFTKRKMPILSDDFVDKDFGTGAVKITPAHDPNDYEVGKRHDLAFVNIFTDDGKIVEGLERFSGMKRFEARKEVTKALKDLGLYVGIKDNPMVLPVCSRSKDIIEPMLKPQWYVKCSEMAKAAIYAVKSGELQLIPKMHEKTWFHWMEEIRDWCISRQLWWGHRIPAYYVTFVKDQKRNEELLECDHWVCGRNESEALSTASATFGVPPQDLALEQDPDVLDTWFSSALFPFSVFGWPKHTEDLSRFYPNNLLETGHDILFFWVARMVFMGQKLLNKLPFKQVYLHAMVCDAHGRKMSKSLGNVIDPTSVIYGITLQELHSQLELNSNLDPKEIARAKDGQRTDYPNGIPECGTDALRFALCAYTAQGRNINLDVLRINGYRNFCNKLWNATKFALMNLKQPFKPLKSFKELIQKTKQVSQQESYRQPNTSDSSNKLSTASNNMCCKFCQIPLDLSNLETHLKTKSYVCGFVPSMCDIKVLNKVLDLSIKIDHLPSVKRWYIHLASFNDEERKQFLARICLKDDKKECYQHENQHCQGSSLSQSVFNSEHKDMEFHSLRLINRWILSQLSTAVSECNAAFNEFNFPRATTAIYNLWWYQICDTYLECTKPLLSTFKTNQQSDVFPDGAQVGEETRQVLFFTLHTALRLVAPFMPFLAEELFQRFPSVNDNGPPSVCVAPYPTNEEYSSFSMKEVDEHFQLGQKVISEIRSAKAKYDIQFKVKIEVFLQVSNSYTKSILQSLLQEIQTLAMCSKVTLCEFDPPAPGLELQSFKGCVPTPVNAEVLAWLKLQGMVDLSKCQERIEKKLTDLQTKLASLNKEIARPGYEKAPEEIRRRNIEKKTDCEAELEQSKDALKKIKALLEQ